MNLHKRSYASGIISRKLPLFVDSVQVVSKHFEQIIPLLSLPLATRRQLLVLLLQAVQSFYLVIDFGLEFLVKGEEKWCKEAVKIKREKQWDETMSNMKVGNKESTVG